MSDVELMRGLVALTPGLAPSDLAFLLKYCKDKFRAASTAQVTRGADAVADNGGMAAGITAAAVAEWVTRQPGGHDSKYSKDAEEEAAPPTPSSGPATASDRLAWGSRAQKFVSFRASWEERHGQAGVKEMAADAATPAEGPTWARAEPTPFRVLRVASGAPAPRS